MYEKDKRVRTTWQKVSLDWTENWVWYNVLVKSGD